MNTNVEHYDYAELIDINSTTMSTLSRGQQIEFSREHQARENEILYDARRSSQYSPGNTEKHELIKDQHNKRPRRKWREQGDLNCPYSLRLSCLKLRRWVKNYPHYRYRFYSWLYCWLSWQNIHGLLLSFHRGSGVSLIVHFCHEFFCHKHGHSQFHLYQKRAEGSDSFFWAEGVPGDEMHSMMSVQYGNSVMSQRIVC
jgi:hypothetical protein